MRLELQDVIQLEQQLCKFRTSSSQSWSTILIGERFQPKIFFFFFSCFKFFKVIINLMKMFDLICVGQHQGQATQHSHKGVYRNTGNQKAQDKERPPAAHAHT